MIAFTLTRGPSFLKKMPSKHDAANSMLHCKHVVKRSIVVASHIRFGIVAKRFNLLASLFFFFFSQAWLVFFLKEGLRAKPYRLDIKYEDDCFLVMYYTGVLLQYCVLVASLMCFCPIFSGIFEEHKIKIVLVSYISHDFMPWIFFFSQLIPLNNETPLMEALCWPWLSCNDVTPKRSVKAH